jgi:hypothetical protein
VIEKARFALFSLLLVTGSVVQTHAAGSSDLAWARVKDVDAWTEVVKSAVAATALTESIPADISAFCPAYEQDSSADRTHFWVGLIAAIDYAETAGRFNPGDSFTESFHEHGPQSPLVVSRGRCSSPSRAIGITTDARSRMGSLYMTRLSISPAG